ncbi:MAG: TetR/AcrR family transcriptional regulator, partial [Pseudomonadota bacterium]
GDGGSPPAPYARHDWRKMTEANKNSSSREHVIDVATTLFWRAGYDGVSIGDIVEASGANRYALYHEFKDKKGVFRAVLEHYVEDSHQLIRSFLERRDRDPVDAVRDAIIAKMLDPEMFPAGCLMCTTAGEMAARDEEIAALMGEKSAAIGETFRTAFAQAQAEGRARTDISPLAFQEVAHALYFSTGLQARMGRSREELLQALEAVCDTFRSKPAT